MLDEIIDLAIQANKTNRERFPGDSLDPYEFVLALGTIHFDFGRRTGKSTFIKERASEEDVILVHSYVMEAFYQDAKAEVFSRDIKEYEGAPKIIWVDEPALHENLSHNLKVLIKNYGQTVIKLGG